MKWHEPITLTVHILSPVAIGTGEKCNTLEFITYNNKVLVVNERKFFGALDEQQQKRFLKWIESLTKRLIYIRQQIWRARDNVQLRRQLDQQRRETESQISLEKFLQEKLKMSRPAKWLHQQKAVRYEVNAIRVPNRYEGFALCIKTPDHRPYIPGSELKGAIRTAVLVKMLNDDAKLLQRLANKVQPNMGRRQLNALWQETEWMLLRRNENDKDAHNDLFRGISISDSEPLPTDALRIYSAKRLNMSRDVTVFVEAIAPGNKTTVTLSIALPDRWLQKIGLTNKADWLDWTKLAQALYEHANAVLDFIARKFPSLKAKAQWLKRQNEPQAPLVCLGWGQGFLSVTMTEPLRRQHSKAYETLRQAMAQAINQYGRTKRNNFPKTIWAALDRKGQPYDLFGWVKLVKR